MKIAFFDITEDWKKKEILKSFKKEEVLLFKTHFEETPISQFKNCDSISCFVYSNITKEILEKLPKVKSIFLRSTGFNNCDINYCKTKKISVFNVPHYGENTVAEFTFSHLLNISRNFVKSINRVESQSFDFSNLRGFDLKNKNIGLIGFGNIGKKMAKMCNGFDMNVECYVRDTKKYEKGNENSNITFTNNLTNLLKKSDIISLHMPLNKNTTHFLSKYEFSKMKKGMILLNTSRGELINTKDLLEALDKKIISYCGFDVIEGEIPIKDEVDLFNKNISCCNEDNLIIQDHKLLNHKNVFVTPHTAFNTIDALKRILSTTIKNIKNFTENKKTNENKVV
jgi:D-lactate dehydrogenase